MGRSFLLMSFKCSQRVGLSIMSLHRLATHSQMAKAENSLRTVKRLFEKCKETSVSEFQVLLDWRNTPSEGMDTSPAQHLMGRRCRALLPMSESLLRQSYPLHGDVRALAGRKWRQKNYYDRHVKPLKPINLGKSRFCWSAQLPGKDW